MIGCFQACYLRQYAKSENGGVAEQEQLVLAGARRCRAKRVVMNASVRSVKKQRQTGKQVQVCRAIGTAVMGECC